MKILHVIPSVGPLRGGPSFAVPVMARGLVQAGLEVHIATTDDNGPGHLDVPLGQPVVQDGVTYWYFRRQTRFYTASWPLTRWLARSVQHYDLLHIHCLFSYATLPAALFAARYDVPSIVRPLGTLNRWGMTHRHPWLKRLSFALIEKRILNKAALIHYTSEQEQAEAQALCINMLSAVIPLGIELDVFDALPDRQVFRSQYPVLSNKFVVLFLGRLDPVKRVEYLLTGFGQLHERYPNSALVLAGQGASDYVSALRSQVADLGLPDAVIWTGFISGAQKLAALAAADVFVVSSSSESFGMSAVEAMASGLPVVLTDGVSIHNEVSRAKAGLVVPCSGDALSAALLRLANNAELRCQLGATGKRLVHERFSVQMMTRSLIAVYEDVLRRCRSEVVV